MYNKEDTPAILQRFCDDWDDWDAIEDGLWMVNAQLAIPIGRHSPGSYVDELAINLYEAEVTIRKDNRTETFSFAPEILVEDEF